MRNLTFETNKSEILPDSYTELDALYDIFQEKYMKNKLLIQGHTDNKGEEKINLLLSQKRAEAVANYLIKKGVPPSSLKTQGFGSMKPIVPNDNEINRQLNRRVEVKIIGSDY
jgi:outer membrane protein OmpA-like peptidoglycan-associated protein